MTPTQQAKVFAYFAHHRERRSTEIAFEEGSPVDQSLDMLAAGWLPLGMEEGE